MVLAACLMLAGFRDHGITWDEPLHVEYGERALDWYLSLGADRSVLEFQNLYLYGALYDTMAAAISLLSPFDAYGTRRLLGGLLGLLGVAAVHRIARDLGGARAGALAAVLLLLTPDWWGHAFNNPKDTPFAVAGAWSAVFLVRLATALPEPRLRDAVGFGLALGAALGIRVGGVLFLGPLGVVGLAWVLLRLGRGAGPLPVLAEAGRIALVFAAALPVAWALMVAAWPWAQLDPVGHPVRALAEFSRFPLDFTFLFAGQTLRTTELPWWYLPMGLAVKLPVPLFLAVAGAAGLGLSALLRGRVRMEAVALAAALLLPPLAVLATHAVLYDGIRHMLFLVPLLAAAAGVALDRLALALPASRRGFRPAALAGAALAGYAAAQAATMVRLHPYQTIWHNALAGGVTGAAGRFELDYWGSAMSEAARALTAAILRREGVMSLTRPYRVRLCGPPGSALYYLPPSWRGVGEGEADFYVAYTRGRCPGAPEGAELVRVERMGIPLAFVLDLRGARP
ncbi:MAG TPA: glycosyltransferase family 39 protein [Azospirillaceae bacterium]|nr:glycosyltransferase family 39 protein [Azospirillaceae bacterium]